MSEGFTKRQEWVYICGQGLNIVISLFCGFMHRIGPWEGPLLVATKANTCAPEKLKLTCNVLSKTREFILLLLTSFIKRLKTTHVLVARVARVALPGWH